MGFKEDEMEVAHFGFNLAMFAVYFFIGAMVNEKIFATYFLAITCSELIDYVKNCFYGDEKIDLEILLIQVCLFVGAIFICFPSFAESFFSAIGF